MPKYEVRLRCWEQTRMEASVVVDADNQKEAENKALDEEPEFEYEGPEDPDYTKSEVVSVKQLSAEEAAEYED